LPFFLVVKKRFKQFGYILLGDSASGVFKIDLQQQGLFDETVEAQTLRLHLGLAGECQPV